MPGNPACGPKNRVWDFFAKTGVLYLATPFVSAALASGKLACGYGNRVDPNCCGEQWDADLGLYYNRARYLNVDSGRFWSQDCYGGRKTDPDSLHKYLYTKANPIGSIDFNGHEALPMIMATCLNVGQLSLIAIPAIKLTMDTTYIVIVVFTITIAAEKAIIKLNTENKSGETAKESAGSGSGEEVRDATEEELEDLMGEDWHENGEKKKWTKEFKDNKEFKKIGSNNPDVRVGKRSGKVYLVNPNDASKQFDTGVILKN